MPARDMQFHVFSACHALHAQNFMGVIGACLTRTGINSLCALGAYSRSRKNLARQLSHHSYKSAFTGSRRPICESGATGGVRGVSENGCRATDCLRCRSVPPFCSIIACLVRVTCELFPSNCEHRVADKTVSGQEGAATDMAPAKAGSRRGGRTCTP